MTNEPREFGNFGFENPQGPAPRLAVSHVELDAFIANLGLDNMYANCHSLLVRNPFPIRGETDAPEFSGYDTPRYGAAVGPLIFPPQRAHLSHIRFSEDEHFEVSRSKRLRHEQSEERSVNSFLRARPHSLPFRAAALRVIEVAHLICWQKVYR